MVFLLLFMGLSSGKVVPGEVILWVKPEFREYISYQKDKSQTGIYEIDAVLKNFGVYEIDRLTKGRIPLEAEKYELDLIFLLKFPESFTQEELIQRLKALESVKFVFPNKAYPLQVIPNDPYFSSMWNLTKMKVPEAWDITQGNPSVVVGGVDSGLWWEHEDIRDNLWVNPGEDINNNGKFDYPSDLNGVDDDGNGYVDDIIGFNFSWGTWNPAPQDAVFSDHGTHVSGTMAAVTNNGIGVSGIGWNIRVAGINCQLIYQDTSYIDFYSTVEAHYYGANMGFSVLNNSWGGYYWGAPERQMMQAAIDYARSKGATIFAAAGNENTSIPLYPASLRGVISVAATTQGDLKAWFSNYGDSVDVCAPGVSIWSTVPNNGYDLWDGTSMASPNAAGVAALIKAYFPGISPQKLEEYLEGGADDIDSLNPSYAGLLGAGRVNALGALQYPFYSGVKVFDFSIFEIVGDGDRFYEPGEIIGILPFVINKGPQPADSFKIVLKPSFGFQVIDSIVRYNQFIGVDDTVIIALDTFKIVLNNVRERDTLLFEIKSLPPTLYQENTFTFFIGVPDVLVYYTDKDNKFFRYYEAALNILKVKYDIWKSFTRGIPSPSSSLPELEMLIWATGNDSINCVKPEEIDSMINYVTGGGKLVLSSQYAAENFDTSYDTLFFRNYLGVDRFKIPLGSGQNKAKGIPGDPLADGWFLYMGSTEGAQNVISPDEILNDTLGGVICVRYGPTGAGGGAGVRTQSAVFFTFPLEAVPLSGNTTLLQEVIHDLFSYFGVDVKERLPSFSSDKERKSLLVFGNKKIKFEKGNKIYSISGRLNKNLHKGGIYFLINEGKKENIKLILIK